MQIQTENEGSFLHFLQFILAAVRSSLICHLTYLKKIRKACLNLFGLGVLNLHTRMVYFGTFLLRVDLQYIRNPSLFLSKMIQWFPDDIAWQIFLFTLVLCKNCVKYLRDNKSASELDLLQIACLKEMFVGSVSHCSDWFKRIVFVNWLGFTEKLEQFKWNSIVSSWCFRPSSLSILDHPFVLLV